MTSDTRNLRYPTIFIVDDDREDVELLLRAFNSLETTCRIYHLSNGKDLFSMLQTRWVSGSQNLPDLLLLDLNMPILDGREVLSMLKDDQRFAHIPTVVFSSSHAENDVLATYALGANSFISKPTNLSGFIETAQSIETYWLKFIQLPT